jgi:membrane-associated phospholipid phosphatase
VGLTRPRGSDVALAVAGAVTLVASAVLAHSGAYGWEAATFLAINRLPGGIRRVLWVLNQYGTALTIPVTVAAALLFRKWLMALSLALSGVAVYWLARVIKEYVARGRPAALVEGVVEREMFYPRSLGYPSGHAAVAWAITIIVLAYLGLPWRIAAVVLAIAVPVSRMYVAAHLPLDLLGGAALGVTIASATNLLLGSPGRRGPERTREGPSGDVTLPARGDPQPGVGAATTDGSAGSWGTGFRQLFFRVQMT